MRTPEVGLLVPHVTKADMFQKATLGGIPCKAHAHVEVTLVEVPAAEGQHKIVEGVRTWRGTAVIQDAAFLARRRLDKPLRYEGILQDGDDERQISADVYVYHTRRAKGDDEPEQEAPGLRPIYVSFVGAGNTQIHPEPT